MKEKNKIQKLKSIESAIGYINDIRNTIEDDNIYQRIERMVDKYLSNCEL